MNTNTKRKIFTARTIQYYWRHARQYPWHIAGLSLSIPVTIFINTIIPPLVLADVLNRLSKHDYTAGHAWQSFSLDLIVYGISILVGTLSWRLVDWLDWSLEGNVERDMAREVFDHLQQQSATFHANTFGGSMVSHTSKLLGSYIRFADTTIFMVAPMVVTLLFVTIILGFHSFWYAATLFVFAIFYTVSSFYVTGPARRLGAEQAARESEQTGVLADAITNVMAIKSFAGLGQENKRFARATDRTRQSLFVMAGAHQKQQVYFGVVLSGLWIIALTMAVFGVVNHHANIATAFLILNYTSTITTQLFQFSNNALRTYNRALGDAADMIETLHITPEIQDPEHPVVAHMPEGNIRFQDVTFKHDGSDGALFQGLNLHIKPGEKVGLVGHSGSGKTTFTRLLLRFSDIQSGSITIDGQDITSVTQDDLRRHIAYVPQEPLLFHRSIAENIAYGAPGASKQAIEAAARMAHAHEFIATLPEGYNTLVGERGVKLSGGQRQRIAIARAMLKNAPILALDEATSALDSESEVLIQQALWKLMEGRTAIVIAHRLSTIQKMDRIIVLDNGSIVEEGSHKELIAQKNGIYARLWAHQSGGFIEE
ncbi:MAG TPA: ABC transporter ATP-binding protein [Candidatus Saccharimonadales bacterium]|nr:ABC transporter ATP-binding protein [Candidatus Saccharimonadales bacterium]